MCGRLNVTDDPAVVDLCDLLGIPLWPRPARPDQGENTLRTNRFVRATDQVSIVHEVSGNRKLSSAIWWLLLDPTESGFKPSKYTSFNTRYDKLNVPRSAGYHAFRHSRCIIPVKGFGETQGSGKNAIYHDFQALDGQALAMGGLCRHWRHPGSGEEVLSCSVITLPPHPKLAAYHSKSCPLILPQDDQTMSAWLDSSQSNTEVFADLLQTSLPQDLQAVQIDKPSAHHPISAPFVIPKD